jgi:hypothetical protein
LRELEDLTRPNKSNLTENNLLEFYMFFVQLILFRAVLPGICLRRNVRVTDRDELNPTIYKMLHRNFNEVLGKVIKNNKNKEREKKENECSVA